MTNKNNKSQRTTELVPIEIAEEEPEQKTPKNFTKEEDIMFVRAFVSCTLDSATGTDERAEVFWNGVHEKFNQLMETEAEVYFVGGRSQESLANRYQRHIQKDAAKWVALYKQNKIESRQTKEDHKMQNLFLLKKSISLLKK